MLSFYPFYVFISDYKSNTFFSQNLKGERKVERNKTGLPPAKKKNPPRIPRFLALFCFVLKIFLGSLIASFQPRGSHFQCVWQSPRELVKTAESPSLYSQGWGVVGQGWVPQICVLIKPLLDSDVGGHWTTLWEIMSFRFFRPSANQRCENPDFKQKSGWGGRGFVFWKGLA